MRIITIPLVLKEQLINVDQIRSSFGFENMNHDHLDTMNFEPLIPEIRKFLHDYGYLDANEDGHFDFFSNAAYFGACAHMFTLGLMISILSVLRN